MVICLTGRCGVPGALPLSYAGLWMLCVTQRLLLLPCHLQVSILHRSFNEKEDNHQLFGPMRSNGATDDV